MRKSVWIFLSLALVACASAEQKPVNKWKVKVTTESQKKIWITKSDGSRQCAAKKSGLSPVAAAEKLKAAGIVVFQSRTGNDGQMYGQQCGLPTGSTVELEISRPDLPRALALGYVSKDTGTD